MVAEYVTRRRRPRDGGACTVPLTTATHTHVRARTAESRGGTPRQDPGNECAVRTTEPAGCSVPSPRRRSACTRARRQRYLAWPGHRRTLLPPWPRPRVPFWLALAPAQSSQSQASATTTTFSFRRPAPTLGKSEEQCPPSPVDCRGWRRLSRCCRGAPPGCHSTAHPLSAPRLIASGSFGPGLTVTITRSSFTFEPPAPGPRALASPLAPRSRECYRSPRTGHTATATFHWTGLDGGSFVRRGAAQRHRRNLRRR